MWESTPGLSESRVWASPLYYMSLSMAGQRMTTGKKDEFDISHGSREGSKEESSQLIMAHRTDDEITYFHPNGIFRVLSAN